MVKLEKTLFSIDEDTGRFAQQELIAIVGLDQCIDTQRVSSHLFLPKKNVRISLHDRNLNTTLLVIALSKRMFVFAELKLTLMQTIFNRN